MRNLMVRFGLSAGPVPFLLVALLATPAAPAAAVPPAGDWSVARSEHFLVVGGGKKVRPEKVARSLEVFREVLARRGHALRLELGVPVTVLLVPGEAPFNDLSGSLAGRPARFSALAVMNAEHPSVLINTKDPSDDEVTNAYRGFMQLALGLDKDVLPVWFREGMAEYYRSFATFGTSVVLGKPVSAHLWTLAHNPLMPLPELLTLDRPAVDALPQARRSVFTAESWALVHLYFSRGYEGKRQLSQLLASQAEKATPEEAARKAWGTDLQAVEKLLHDYARQRRFTSTIVDLERLPTGKEIPVEVVGAEDARRQFVAARDAAREIAGILRTPPRETSFPYPLTKPRG